MLKRKWFWACVLVPLYILTWVGGWITHARQLQESAEAGYRSAERENQENEAEARLTGFKYHPIELREGGPTSHVYWCVPVLPGVLLTDSDYFVGPMYAGGGVQAIFYYGFGSTDILKLGYWRA